MIAFNETDEKENASLHLYRSGVERRFLFATGHVILYVGHRRYQRLRSSIPSLLAIKLRVTLTPGLALSQSSSTLVTLALFDALICDCLLSIW